MAPLRWKNSPHLPPRRCLASLGSAHGPVVLSIPLAVVAKERSTRLAYSHAQDRLHAIRPDSPGIREAAMAVLRKACEGPALRGWLLADQDTATMGTSEAQAVFDLPRRRIVSEESARAAGLGPAVSIWIRGDGGVSLPSPHSSACPGMARLQAVETGCGGRRARFQGGYYPATAPPAGRPQLVLHQYAGLA